MSFDFNNPPLASEELVATFKVEELKGQCNKHAGVWVCGAYIDRGDRRIIVAVSHGKKAKPVLRECMSNAIKRIEDYGNDVSV